MKKPVCDNPNCAKKCLNTLNHYACVAIGYALAVFGVVYHNRTNILGFLKDQAAWATTYQVIAGAGVIFLILLGVASFFSKFEQFDNQYSAMFFGASFPPIIYLVIQIGNGG